MSGRTQMVQAEAAHLIPHADMNPVLLKPSGPPCCQVVMRGVVWGDLPAVGSARFLAEAWTAIADEKHLDVARILSLAGLE